MKSFQQKMQAACEKRGRIYDSKCSYCGSQDLKPIAQDTDEAKCNNCMRSFEVKHSGSMTVFHLLSE